MKLTHIILACMTVIILSGCGPAILAVGSIVGMGYVANDIDENYNGDAEEYIQEKTDSVVDQLSGEN